MRWFSFTITLSQGLHAIPATQLVEEARKYGARTTLSSGGKTCDAKDVFAVLGMGISQGEAVALKCEGPDEERAVAGLSACVRDNGI